MRGGGSGRVGGLVGGCFGGDVLSVWCFGVGAVMVVKV